MPTYQYVCKNCGHELEELQSMNEPPLVQCPNCGKETLVRIMGSGGGFIFKGSGFYKTDYNKSVEKKAPATEKTEKREGNKTESTPASSPKETTPPPPPPPNPKKD